MNLLPHAEAAYRSIIKHVPFGSEVSGLIKANNWLQDVLPVRQARQQVIIVDSTCEVEGGNGFSIKYVNGHQSSSWGNAP